MRLSAAYQHCVKGPDGTLQAHKASDDARMTGPLFLEIYGWKINNKPNETMEKEVPEDESGAIGADTAELVLHRSRVFTAHYVTLPGRQGRPTSFYLLTSKLYVLGPSVYEIAYHHYMVDANAPTFIVFRIVSHTWTGNCRLADLFHSFDVIL